jgi:hypothetical protein
MSLDRLGEFHYGKVPEKPRRILESLPLMSEKERVRSSGEHLMKGIRYFQSEDLEGAIKMWEAAVGWTWEQDCRVQERPRRYLRGSTRYKPRRAAGHRYRPSFGHRLPPAPIQSIHHVRCALILTCPGDYDDGVAGPKPAVRSCRPPWRSSRRCVLELYRNGWKSSTSASMSSLWGEGDYRRGRIVLDIIWRSPVCVKTIPPCANHARGAGCNATAWRTTGRAFLLKKCFGHGGLGPPGFWTSSPAPTGPLTAVSPRHQGVGAVEPRLPHQRPRPRPWAVIINSSIWWRL